MKYFVFAMIFILSALEAKAQDFFMPDNALSSSADRLKPLKQNSLSGYNQRRYKVIDGRVLLLPDEPEPVSETQTPAIIPETEDIAEPSLADITPANSENLPPMSPPVVSETPTQQPVHPLLPEPTFEKSAPIEAESKHHIMMPEPQAPNVQEPDNKHPSYQNRYAQYVTDLKTFQKTGKLPQNKELENIIQKLTKTREVILFEGEVK